MTEMLLMLFLAQAARAQQVAVEAAQHAAVSIAQAQQVDVEILCPVPSPGFLPCNGPAARHFVTQQ